jgi:hypothetical protein
MYQRIFLERCGRNKHTTCQGQHGAIHLGTITCAGVGQEGGRTHLALQQYPASQRVLSPHVSGLLLSPSWPTQGLGKSGSVTAAGCFCIPEPPLQAHAV